MVYKVLEKKSRDNSARTGAAIMSEDQQLPNELHKPITRNQKYTCLIEIKFMVLLLQRFN